MESIETSEKVAQPEMTQTVPEKHTVTDHRQCAYYPNLSLNTMTCEHGELATGAFYSEDYIKDLVVTAQRLWLATSGGQAMTAPSAKQYFARLRELTK